MHETDIFPPPLASQNLKVGKDFKGCLLWLPNQYRNLFFYSLDRWLYKPLLEYSWWWGTHFCTDLNVRKILLRSGQTRFLGISVADATPSLSVLPFKPAPSFLLPILMSRATDQLLRSQAPYIRPFSSHSLGYQSQVNLSS